jgi:hypothetical protein
MPDIDPSKWPLPYQLAALLGALIMGGIAWLRGGWRKSGDSDHTSDRLQARLDTQELRAEVIEVVRVAREGMENRIEMEIKPLEERVRQIELRLERIEALTERRH